MTEHYSILLTGAKTQTTVFSCEGKEEGGKAKINNKAFCKNSRRRNNSKSVFWFVQLFFLTVFYFLIPHPTVELTAGAHSEQSWPMAPASLPAPGLRRTK